MLTVATMGLLFSPYLEHGYVKGFRSRFSGMVFLGDVLRVGGRVSGVEEMKPDDCTFLRCTRCGGMIRSHRGRSSSWSTEVSLERKDYDEVQGV
jgi:acyl dehydratase